VISILRVCFHNTASLKTVKTAHLLAAGPKNGQQRDAVHTNTGYLSLRWKGLAGEIWGWACVSNTNDISHLC